MKKTLTFLSMLVIALLTSIPAKAGTVTEFVSPTYAKHGILTSINDTFPPIINPWDSTPPYNIPVNGIQVNPDTLVMYVYETAHISANVLPLNASNPNIIINILNSNVVSINHDTREVTALFPGFAVITFETADGGYRKQIAITVLAHNTDTIPPQDSIYTVPVTDILVAPDSIWLDINQQAHILANVLPYNATNQNIIIHNPNPDIVSIDVNTRMVTALAPGLAFISFTTEEGQFSRNCLVYVTENQFDTIPPQDSIYTIPVTDIIISPDSIWLEINQQAHILANVLPYNATNQNIIIHNPNPDIVSIDVNTRMVTALAPGLAFISFTTEEGQFSRNCLVYVTENQFDTIPPQDSIYTIPVTDIIISPDSIWLDINQQAHILANVLPYNATNQNIIIHNPNPDIVSIDVNTRMVTALAPGLAFISFTTEEGQFSRNCLVYVTENQFDTIPPQDSIPDYDIPVTGIQVSPDSILMYVFETTSISVNVLPLDATNQNISIHNLNPNIVSINPSTGDVTALFPGFATIIFTTQDGGYMGYTSIVVMASGDTTGYNQSLLSGIITRQDGSVVTSGMVLLYSMSDEGASVLIDTTAILPDGSYLFSSVEYGNYLINAIAFDIENTVPTYYGNTESWENATVVSVQDETPLTTLNIVVIDLPTIGGSATISGHVGDSPGKSGMANPRENVTVFLQAKQGSIFSTIATTKTNEEGYYEFRNVPVGEYQVILDVPGLGMLNAYTIQIVQGDENMEGNDYEITDEGIKTTKSTTGIQSPDQEDVLYRLYPNPTKGLLTIQNLNGSENVVEIYSHEGRLVSKYQISGTETTVNMQDLSDGIYILRIGNKTMKVIKQ